MPTLNNIAIYAIIVGSAVIAISMLGWYLYGRKSSENEHQKAILNSYEDNKEKEREVDEEINKIELIDDPVERLDAAAEFARSDD